MMYLVAVNMLSMCTFYLYAWIFYVYKFYFMGVFDVRVESYFNNIIQDAVTDSG